VTTEIGNESGRGGHATDIENGELAPGAAPGISDDGISGANEVEVNILLVDDRKENLQALEALLAGFGARLVSVSSGEMALRFLLDHDVAVILLDVQMPGMDGFETADLIRKRARFNKTPIIFLTAIHSTDEDVRKGYALGAVDYINKPIVPEILLSKVTVFVDLFVHRELAKARDRLEREARELKRELEGMHRTFGAWQGAGSSAPFASTALPPSPETVRPLQKSYRSLLEDYVISGSDQRPPPHEGARHLAERIGELGGGPREVTSLHLAALETLCRNALPRRERVLRAQCRLMTLEIMGHLVDYYRPRSCAGKSSRGVNA
jgi:CheY-like chemotaxis protein